MAPHLMVKGLPPGSDELLRHLIDSLSDAAVVLLGPDGRVANWNGGAERLLGFTSQEMLDNDGHILLGSKTGNGDDFLQSAKDNGLRRERWLVRRNGVKFWGAFHLAPLWGDDAKLLGFVLVLRDLTEQRRLQQNLQESERRFRGIFDQAFECVALLKPDGAIVDANHASRDFGGLDSKDVIGRLLWDTAWLGIDAGNRPSIQAAIAQAAQGKFVRDELEIAASGGTRIYDFSLKPIVDGAGHVALLIAEAREVTDRKRMEMQLHQKQKMEAIGQLAGGIAHDFNNLLVVIIACSELLLNRMPADMPLRDLAGEIFKAGERAATLTRQLLAFGRLQVLAPRLLDLNTVIIDLEKMLRRIIGEDIDFATILDPDLKQVLADPGQMEQVLLNLVVNARDAMPQGGKITITTRNLKLDPSYAQTHLETTPGRYVLLSVTDTGCGMTAEVKKRIFEPFFTTKEKGKGTGLGLSTVFGIVKQSGGLIEVYSEPNQGTTFKIYLPEAADAPGAKPMSAVMPPPPGTETILLVEDDESVRAVTRDAFRSWGYRVLEAADGVQAVRIANDYPDTIHLVVSDVVMPNLGGHQLTERLLTLRPAMKVLYLSGFADDAVVRHGILNANVNFLQKPFSLFVLAHKTRSVLDKP